MIIESIIQDKRKTLEQDISNRTPKVHGIIAKQMKAYDSLFVISEIKKAAPNKEQHPNHLNVQHFASVCDEAGINAISIITEKNYFKGSLDDIVSVRCVSDLPILRSDYILDARELIQTKQAGANLVLLMVAILSDRELKEFYQTAQLLGLECIVEVHNEVDLKRALSIQPEIIGIDNRDLNYFKIDLNTTKELIRKIPKSISVISESGIVTHEDMEFVKKYGVDGVLIGESLLHCKHLREHLLELKYGKQ
ncbi:MAG: indole-3-glycerol-phosphate synthase [Longicatena sp.]